MLGDGPEVRASARAAISRYLGQPNYRTNLLRAGIAAADVEALADPLVDALVATGDPDDLRERIAAMQRAAPITSPSSRSRPPAGRPTVETARAVAPVVVDAGAGPETLSPIIDCPCAEPPARRTQRPRGQ